MPLFALCGVAGYLTSKAFISPPLDGSSTPVKPPAAVAPLVPATAADSSFIAEWETLRGTAPAGPDSLPALYAEIKNIKDSFRRRTFRSALLAEWALTNPQAGLAYLAEKDSFMAAQLMREWLRLDANGAVNALLAGGEKQRSNLRSVLNDIARLAPERLAEVISALPKSQSRWDSTALNAFALAAAKDPEGARRAAESVTGPLRGQALAGVAQAWAEKEGNAALTWGQAMPPGEERDTVLKAALTGWAKTDPMAALDRVDLVPPGGEEGFFASDVGALVLREAGKKDWDGTLRWLLDHPGKLGRSSLDGLQEAMSHRMAVDPTGTLRSISASGVPGMDNVLANSLLNDGYSQRDAVWQWLDQQPANEFTKSARASVVNAVAWKEPMLALSFLDRLPDTPENRSIIERGVASMLNGGSQMHLFEEFMEAASPKMRPLLLEAGFSYGIQGSVGDPQRWIKRLDELPEDRRNNAAQALASHWAREDPTAAIRWALSFPESQQRDSVFGFAAATWASTDAYETAQWIDQQPAGSMRDIATQSLVNALATSEPETAWTWALTIGGEGQRLGALSTVYANLRQRNPDAAAQLLASANLSPQLVERLRKTPEIQTSIMIR